MKTLSVFTPTFDRAHLLPRLYDSLLRQTCQDFTWVIVDDGSTDGTAALVSEWIGQGQIEIIYKYKANGGMHTAHNLAYSVIDTVINTCIDSDDWMPDDSVATIIRRWQSVSDDASLAGMVGLDARPDGSIIGTPLPVDGTRATLGGLYESMQVKGDKKLVYRSEVTRSFPRYPEYAGEKLVPLGWLYRLIDQRYSLACFNDVFAIVEYQPGGSSASVIHQYFQSPRGFRESRIVTIRHAVNWKERLRNVVHFGVSSRILGMKFYQLGSPAPVLSVLCTPVVELAYIYLKRKRVALAGHASGSAAQGAR